MENKQLFADIIKQVSAGHSSEYEALSREIKKREEKELCNEYKKVLGDIGNNPLEEKELSDIIEKANKGEISSFEVAAKILGKEFSKAKDMEQVTILIKQAIQKIVDFRDENNILKKTPSIETYEPMSPIDRMKFENLKIESSKITDEKEKDKKDKQIDKFVAKATNIDMEELTDWEKGLFLEILNEEAKDITNIFLGKK